MSTNAASLQDRIRAKGPGLSPAETRVARYFLDHRETAMISAAAEIAAELKTSDATVVRTAKSLGFNGLDDLRRQLAEDLRNELTPAGRVVRTLDEVGGEPGILGAVMHIHRQALDRLERRISGREFSRAVAMIAGAERVAVFGLGPSSQIAGYFAVQAGRLGLDVITLAHSGLLLADDLNRLRKGDLLVLFAYGRVYAELTALIDRADELGMARILLTDTLGPKLADSIDLVLDIPRGRADLLSMHTATLAFLEALLVGIAAKRPEASIASLERLNSLRQALARQPMDL